MELPAAVSCSNIGHVAALWKCCIPAVPVSVPVLDVSEPLWLRFVNFHRHNFIALEPATHSSV